MRYRSSFYTSRPKPAEIARRKAKTRVLSENMSETLTEEQSKQLLQRVASVVTKAQSGEGRRFVVTPKSGSNHFTVRLERDAAVLRQPHTNS